MMKHFSTLDADRRQTYRLAIHVHARITFALDDADPDDDSIQGVTLTDISRDGLMAADAGQLVPGVRVLLDVPVIGWREAEVRWISDNRAGCRFIKPLTLDELRFAAVSSERLTGECPEFAQVIAEMPQLDRPILISQAGERLRENSGRWWPIAVAPLVGIAVICYVAVTIVLDSLG